MGTVGKRRKASHPQRYSIKDRKRPDEPNQLMRYAGRLRAQELLALSDGKPQKPLPAREIEAAAEARKGFERAVARALGSSIGLLEDGELAVAISRAYEASKVGTSALHTTIGDASSNANVADVLTWARRLSTATADRESSSFSLRVIAETATWNESTPRRRENGDTREALEVSSIGNSVLENGDSAHAPASWLRMRCEQLDVVKQSDRGLSAAEMAISVLTLLTETSRSSEELQGDLFDALGGDFDAVGELLSMRDKLAEQADAILADCTQAEELRMAGYNAMSGSSASHASAPSRPRRSRGVNAASKASRDAHSGVNSLASSLSITTTRETAMEKQRRKDEERAIRAGVLPGYSASQDDESAGDELRPGLGGSAMEELRKAFPGITLEGNSMIGGRDRVGLPAGASRVIGKGYEEVLVPPPYSPPLRGLKLVDMADALSDHPELLMAMKGVKTLNRLQSAVYPAAYKSNENLLVCAPTGAGKTNVALLTILREIAAVRERRQANFKVVYVAPMKALAAEVVDKFSSRLGPLSLRVREFTGDMSLTRRESLETHVLVTTPEKWDVVTRKSGSELSDSVTLFIIDEIHLLHDDRGSVLESIVARTLRLSETAQRVIRLVGLSATLPNYADVAAFMRVNPSKGLFHFDGTHRPVPLSQSFIGVTEGGTSNSGEARKRRAEKMTEIAWNKVLGALRRGHQAMVFVHSRKATSSTGRDLAEIAAKEEASALLLGGKEGAAIADDAEVAETTHALPTWAAREVAKSRTGEIRELCSKGIGIHHAGLPRADRKLVENLFAEGALRVLCCTATLAWGVNLPARAVIILGTDVYDAQKGGFVQLGMLDVMQIFGRAGRPQFDTEGEGTIITRHENLARYLNLLTSAIPIESTLGASASVLADHLNAEIVSGTVSSVGDGVTWLSYTYLSVRMAQNPLVYGIDWSEVAADPGLHSRRAGLVEQAAKALDDARMCRYDPRTGSLAPTDLGRVSSHFYVSHRTVVLWNELLAKIAEQNMGTSDAAWEEMDATVLHAVSCASEFEQMRSREEELSELDELERDACFVKPKAGAETREGKVNILLQAYISRANVRISDLSYVVQSCTRLLRALFEVSLRRGLPSLALSALEFARASESRVWPFQHPLLQFAHGVAKGECAIVQSEVVARLEDLGEEAELHTIRSMDRTALASALKSPKYASNVLRAASAVPTMEITEASVAPITRTVLRITVVLMPTFVWRDGIHGGAESWWIWVEDHEHERIYHSERLYLPKRQYLEVKSRVEDEHPNTNQKGLTLEMTVPVFDPPSAQYWVRVESERWHTGGGSSAALSLRNFALPQGMPPHTELLDLRPLEVSRALPPELASLYSQTFTHFNPVQTQVFHTAYCTSQNMFVGAPTGSGKTTVAELALFRSFEVAPDKSVVYIAPMKSVVRQRAQNWKTRLAPRLGRTIVELHEQSAEGSISPGRGGNIILATPEAWEAYSRRWRSQELLRNVATIILDEVHLIGGDQGSILEIVASRALRLSLTQQKRGEQSSEVRTKLPQAGARLVAFSTSVANASELGDWLGVSPREGLFNFHAGVRPIPCERHIVGVAGDRWGPRMQSMNRPAYSAICRYAAYKPVLIFVASRRQSRLTAIDILRLASADGKPRRFVGRGNESGTVLRKAVSAIRDPAAREALALGVGIHHTGLSDHDRATIEHLFANQVIQVLISTRSLAWGIDLRATLVIVKGTESYLASEERYVDMPTADILQMVGRAGRPQLDTQAYAVLLVHEPKKTFLGKFLFDPFPVESTLHTKLDDYLSAEICAGTMRTLQDGLDFLTWTYFFRRMFMNPRMYDVHVDGAESERSTAQVQPTAKDISTHCSRLVETSLKRLVSHGCAQVCTTGAQGGGHPSSPGNVLLRPTTLGHVAVAHGLPCRNVGAVGRSVTDGMSEWDILFKTTEHGQLLQNSVQYSEDRAIIEYAAAVADRMVQAGVAKSTEAFLQKWKLNGRIHSAVAKARLILLGHLARVPAPGIDSEADLREALDLVSKYISVVLEIAAEQGRLETVLSVARASQMLYQGCIPSQPFTAMCKVWHPPWTEALASLGIKDLPQALHRMDEFERVVAKTVSASNSSQQVMEYLSHVPELKLTSARLSGMDLDVTLLVESSKSASSTQGGNAELTARVSSTARTSAKAVKRREHCWLVIASSGSEVLGLCRVRSSLLGGGGEQLVSIKLACTPDANATVLVQAVSDAYVGLRYDIKASV